MCEYTGLIDPDWVSMMMVLDDEVSADLQRGVLAEFGKSSYVLLAGPWVPDRLLTFPCFSRG